MEAEATPVKGTSNGRGELDMKVYRKDIVDFYGRKILKQNKLNALTIAHIATDLDDMCDCIAIVYAVELAEARERRKLK